MPQTNAEADPLFQLLTDALRAGPGSPEWHQAVVKLRDGGVEHADEYRLLVAAREHLESGRDYRSIRAGAGFTRKLLDNLDGQGTATRRGPGTATVIAGLSGLVILAVVVVVGVLLMNRGPVETPQGTAEELAQTYFPTQAAEANFEGGGPLPADWKSLGPWTLAAGKGGLRPGSTTAPADGAAGGVLLAPFAVPAGEPFAAEVRLRLNRPADDVIVEFFVSADAPEAFSPDRATSANELVWLLRGTRQQVVLGENAQQKADVPRPDVEKTAKTPADREMTVRVLVNRDVAVVEANRQRLWAGPHGLPAAPRQVGVRFLRAGSAGKAPEPATIQSIKLFQK